MRLRLLVTALAALAMLALPSLAAAKDRNHDHIPDRWEKRHHLSLAVNQANRDQDRDHLDNLGEFQAGDNPRDKDTDNDGVMDGQENAGTIASYDTETGKLTINLFGGETLTGYVTEDTEVHCGHTCNHGDQGSGEGEEASASDDGPDGPGDSHNGPPPPPPPGNEAGADDQGSDGGQQECTVADLVVGAEVAEASLSVRNGKATFEEIALAP